MHSHSVSGSISFPLTYLSVMANNCNCNNCKLLCIIINMSHWAADSLRFGDINENCENEFSFHIVVSLWPTIFATNMRQPAVAENGGKLQGTIESPLQCIFMSSATCGNNIAMGHSLMHMCAALCVTISVCECLCVYLCVCDWQFAFWPSA